MRRLSFILCLGLAATAISWTASAQSGPVIAVGSFSTAPPGPALPAGWKPLIFKRVAKPTVYSVVNESGTAVVKAVSEGGGSGLFREVRIDLRETPVLQWRWKISNVLPKGNVLTRDGDDFPARLFVSFAYDKKKFHLLDWAKYAIARTIYGPKAPIRTINYVWDAKAPAGTVVATPYTDWVMVIVAESGAERLNQWVVEERNVFADYKRAFGEEPSEVIGVALMTDTDTTRDSATAYYGDILFKSDKDGETR